MGDHDGRLTKKGKGFKQCRPQPWVILYCHVSVWLERTLPWLQVRRKHEEADVVKEGGQFQLVQDLVIKLCGLSDPKRNRCCLLPMSGLPRKKPIQFFRDLADQNAFQIAT
jgi:hypothetical protein